MIAVAILVVLVCMAGIYLLLHDSIDEKATAEQLAAQRGEDAEAARNALQAQCDVGIASACDQLAGLEDPPEVDPDDPEVQDSEIQEPEVQNPDPDDPERQNPEVQNPENQQPDTDDPESQDPDVNDPETQDGEVDEPDPDDPDPNSALTFAVRDDCDPAAGEYILDVGLDVEVTGSTVTYVVTCVSAPLPGPLRALL